MKPNKIFIILSLIFFLSSCGTIKEGFKNQKKDSSDEFLVEKKSPLVMPPDYDQLPLPGSNNKDNITDNRNIKSIISETSKEKDQNTIENSNESFETSILKKIKKN